MAKPPRKPRKPRKKAASKKPRKKAASKSSKPPRGFKLAGQDEARKRIEKLLKDASDFLSREEIDSRVYIHVNRDDSIDGELNIPSLRGTTTDDVFDLLHQPVHPAAFPNRNYRFIWISVGARFTFSGDEDEYTRYRGLSQIQTNHRRYLGKLGAIDPKTGRTRLTLPLVFLAARKIARNIEKKFRKKVTQIFVRLNWNPDNRQPERQ